MLLAKRFALIQCCITYIDSKIKYIKINQLCFTRVTVNSLQHVALGVLIQLLYDKTT